MHMTGTSGSFTASHVMPGVEGPEGVLHSHDYRVDVVVCKDKLDPQGMVIDLDVLCDALKSALEELQGQDLQFIRPDEVNAVTVEVIAEWVWNRIFPAVASPGVGEVSVRVYEDEFSFGGYVAG